MFFLSASPSETGTLEPLKTWTGCSCMRSLSISPLAAGTRPLSEIDDMLLSAKSAEKTGQLLDESVSSLEQVVFEH